MTSVREKIARAIYEKRNGAGVRPWSTQSGAHKLPYLMDADAVLDALMGPEKAMIFFGMDAMCRDDMGPTEDEFRAGFVAAIRAAKEGK